ncbi:hypothetical protein, partial [Marinobacter sp.]
MNIKPIVCLFSSAMILAGCGGGSDGSENSPEDVARASGKVIDGYISGATVFLDLNFNGARD